MIDQEQVKKVALLARLDLTPTEEAQFTEQLSSILDYFEQLGELDTDQVLPTTRAIELSNVMRSDELRVDVDPSKLLAIAPETEDGYFRVPQILSSDEA
ncbi:Asp-tRNA(Asn)/Glu-tRNA(Gln) amidotransferase subunit GatC [Gloeocapsa sp. PCC 73106]|uniref:Asp-tRNA(Asn)/Glu-tRNA(Gln) amidotransferase subunit GatC n=1 Tax=Gloeocapsa sp. PCC 73106 TaxID=102232 RepID=UPI0002ACCF3C|nr:Asp-tRNA(Asn)/Glu-tRNA(Gln) amidotransferase subunit GatC [Gloeocapsa sp. PCC 73106]ELR97272.1 glutamyl-tRNA(Gln) and/or aspartyl-tRNA(Asn) amidotransferase, C subunit [Gloeocapsa sp. PCC 73106]